MYKKLGYNKESLGHVIIFYQILAWRKSSWFNQASRISWTNLRDRIFDLLFD